MIDQIPHSFFEQGPIRAVAFPQWMDWASGKEGADHAVVLPMIQRGSVWAPHKLMDLWDTLLRDMPIGAFMASEQTGEVTQKVIPTGQISTRQAKANDIALIDGQQRTLAMMVGWTGLPHALRPVALWVDVAQAPQGEYRFRLWATTRSQPFGYEKASAGGQTLTKLARYKLRQVNHLWPKNEQTGSQTLWATPGFMPWESTLALPLPEVMERHDEAALMELVAERKSAKVDWLKAKLTDIEKLTVGEDAQKQVFLNAVRGQLAERLTAIESASGDAVNQRVKALIAARHKVEASQFPVIQVREAHFASEVIEDKDNTDPPLAILFKRVGENGEKLSDADYVYAVIKHLAPDVHDMVEAMLKDLRTSAGQVSWQDRIQAIYTATSLVMSAVRMMVLKMGEARKSEGTGNGNANAGLNDTAKMGKAAFARLVRKHPDCDEHPGFVKQFKAYIQPGGEFQTSLKAVLDALAYEPETFTAGLPKHALCLVQIPLLETILAWVTLNNSAPKISSESRLPMVRFVLQGYLCVLDAARASEVMVKAIREDALALGDVFPDQALLNRLVPSDANRSQLAHALPSPDTLKKIEGLTDAKPSDETRPLVGWKRFDIKTDTQVPHAPEHAQLYKRWWNRSNSHVHPMLLWLQRDYVFTEFESKPAMAGLDDETPFDYDHLVPSAHWANWTGAGKNSGALTEFEQDGKGSYGYTGNCIGNLHALESSANRARGDTPLECMLTKGDFAKNGLVSGHEKWTQASPNNEAHRTWTKERALAFQAAVEQRAFELYKQFYTDLQCTGV